MAWNTDPETVKEDNQASAAPAQATGNSSTDAGNIQQQQTGQPVQNGAPALLLVCHNARCTCDKAVDPAPKPLKVLSHDKYFINDNGESKLIATTKENALPNLNFGKCKVPNPNNPSPCTAKLQWKDYYDHVELPGGAYVLTEKSIAICTAKGGNIKIVQHGQQSNITTKEVEKANAGGWAVNGPIVTEELIYTESQYNNTDTDGASVKSIEPVLYGTSQPVNTPVEFKAHFNGNPTDAQKQGVNWMIYNTSGEPMQLRTDVGERLKVTFNKPGTYLIEAYGKTSGDKKVTTAYTVKENEIGQVKAANNATKVRIHEPVQFSVSSLFDKLPLPGNASNITWSVTKNSGPGIPQLLNTSGPTTQVICNDEATYVVTANLNGTPKQSKLIEAAKNVIFSVSASKSSGRVNDTINFTVKNQFKISPANELEKAAVKWQVVDAQGNPVAEFAGKTGEAVDLRFNKPGEYTVQPYMVKPSSKVAVKVTIAQPALLKAQWEYPEGGRKNKTGWNEPNRPMMVFQSAEGLMIDLEFGFINKDGKATPVAMLKGIKIPDNQTPDLKGHDFVPDRSKLKSAVNEGDLFYFKVIPQSKEYEIENANVPQPQDKLKLVTGEQIVSIEFLKAGKPVINAQYGDQMQCRIRTRNLSAQKLNVQIYRQESRMGVDALRQDTLVLNGSYPITAGGLVVFDFTLNKAWEKTYSEKLHHFYAKISEAEFFGTSATLVAFKNDVQANGGGHAMVGVEETKKVADNKDGVCNYEAKIRAFMRMIRIGEGTEDEAGYTRIIGGSTFVDHGKDMSTHPKVYIKKYDSTAAGAYQITKTNWNDEDFSKWRNNHKINDYSAASQDKYCYYLLKEKKKAIDLIKKGDIKSAIAKCSSEWASLPGAGYGQREEKLDDIVIKYSAFYQEELKGKTTLHIEKGFLKEFGDNCCSGGANVAKATNTGVTIRLVRKWQTKLSTIGEFTIDGTDIKGYILEEKGPDTTTSGIEQRIPVGTYNLVWHNGTKKKNVLKLYNADVSQSRAILIHSGNDASDTEGCLLVGSTRSKDFVGNSQIKLKEINDYVKLKGIDGSKIIITANYE